MLTSCRHNIVEPTTLIIGEIYVDFTMRCRDAPPKMRLGGIVHAARGMWAAGLSYAVAAICPEYLMEQAKEYLEKHGCGDFILLGVVNSSPNVIIIDDVREVGHQGYEDLLRDVKTVTLRDVGSELRCYNNVVVFPGRYSLDRVATLLDSRAHVTVDVAYDVASLQELEVFSGQLECLVISTSSDLFMQIGSSDFATLASASKSLGCKYFLLKENRGGSRLLMLNDDEVNEIPAVLGETVNSVGVGDVYTAVFAGLRTFDAKVAAWRGAQVATQYALTTFPDDFLVGARRALQLEIETVYSLGGVSLPWHVRRKYPIYLAGPDFSYFDKPEIEAAVNALTYHNFDVRRPVQENGEAPLTSRESDLRRFYDADVRLLEECALVFAVPLGRDPGTLVEVGLAIAARKPLVIFDPRTENKNTMVICGSNFYSSDLDQCLNSLFSLLSRQYASAS